MCMISAADPTTSRPVKKPVAGREVKISADEPTTSSAVEISENDGNSSQRRLFQT